MENVKELYQTIAHADAWNRFKKEFTAKFILEHKLTKNAISLSNGNKRDVGGGLHSPVHETILVRGGPCLHHGKNDKELPQR